MDKRGLISSHESWVLGRETLNVGTRRAVSKLNMLDSCLPHAWVRWDDVQKKLFFPETTCLLMCLSLY